MGTATTSPAIARGPRPPSRPPTPRAHQYCDVASGVLLLAMVGFAPWLFGTTEPWSILLMNILGWTVGALLVAKLVIRRLHRFSPPAWSQRHPRLLVVPLAILTGLILLFSLIAALNARADYIRDERRFEYFENQPNLPTTYDRGSTWKTFGLHLGLAGFFWGMRDWLNGKSKRERRKSNDPNSPEAWEDVSSGHLPDRLRILLWLVALNGAALATQGILQRLSGTSMLLWMRQSYWGDPETCFGPFSYRSNASQYLNLIWPVALGLWWLLRDHQASRAHPLRVGQGAHILLVPSLVLIAAAPFISTSRGGAIISIAELLAACAILWFGARSRASTRWGIAALGVVSIAISLYLGWGAMGPRLKTLFDDKKMAGRGEIYDNSHKIVEDFPIYGTGPGSFAAIYQLYRQSSKEAWQGNLHDDYLELRVTFGWVGFFIVLAMLLLALSRPLLPGGIEFPRTFVLLLWLALGGALAHAKYDFPFQIYSITQLFLALCAILTTLSITTATQSKK